MNKIEITLSQIGLSEKEIKIYLALFSLGSAPASILGKRTGIKRSTAVYTCQQLHKKGLINMILKGEAYLFTYEHPKRLKKLLWKQKRAIAEKEDRVDEIMEDLERMIVPEAVIPKVRFYEGVDGIIELANDFLKQDKPVFGTMMLTEEMHPEIKRYMQKQYIPKRKRMGHASWMIFDDNTLTRNYQKQDQDMNRKSLLVPYDQFPFDSCMHIYGNKVAFYSYNINDMTGVVIENQIIQKSQMSIFRLAWNSARQLKQNKAYSNLNLPI